LECVEGLSVMMLEKRLVTVLEILLSPNVLSGYVDEADRSSSL
jgi:hypothetical protein